MDPKSLLRCAFLLVLSVSAGAPAPACDLHNVKPSEQACLLNQLLHIITHLVNCTPKPAVTDESYKKLLEATNCRLKEEPGQPEVEEPKKPEEAVKVVIEIKPETVTKPPEEPITLPSILTPLPIADETEKPSEVEEPKKPEQPVTVVVEIKPETVTNPPEEIITLPPIPTPLSLVHETEPPVEDETENSPEESEESTESTVAFPTMGPIIPITWFPTNPFTIPDEEITEEVHSDVTASPELKEEPEPKPETPAPITEPVVEVKVEIITPAPTETQPSSESTEKTEKPEEPEERKDDSSVEKTEHPDLVVITEPAPVVTVPPPVAISWTLVPPTTPKPCQEDSSEEEKPNDVGFTAQTFFIPVLKFHGGNCMSPEELRNYLFNYLSCPKAKSSKKTC